MAKLTGAKKAAFLERMAKGRRRAKRTVAAKSNPVKTKKKQARKKPAGRSPAKAHRTQMKRVVKSGAPRDKMDRARQKLKARRRGRNPDDIAAARQKFEEFHGKPAGRVIEYEKSYRYPDNFAEMGKLKELRFDLDEENEDFPLTAFKGCQAVVTPDGSNIYFIGGDQSIDFEALDIASDKDFVELGPCTYICYHTIKGFHDFDPTDYWHRFGEEDGVYPVLAYDRLNKALFLIGGNYRVRPEGIVN